MCSLLAKAPLQKDNRDSIKTAKEKYASDRGLSDAIVSIPAYEKIQTAPYKTIKIIIFAEKSKKLNIVLKFSLIFSLRLSNIFSTSSTSFSNFFSSVANQRSSPTQI